MTLNNRDVAGTGGSLHKRRTHPGPDVPGCFGCRVATVALVVPPHMRAGT